MAPSPASPRLTFDELREIAFANAYRDLQRQDDISLLLHPLPVCPACGESPTQILFPINAALFAESPDDSVKVTFLDCRS